MAVQNNSCMVICFFLMLCEIGIICEVNLIFIIRGHTKNVCDELFALLKKYYYYKNLYTQKQCNDVLDSHRQVKSVYVDHTYLFDLDSLLDEYYNRPLTGTVNCSHVFSANNKEPGVLKLQNSASNVAATQNLMTGTFYLTEQRM